MREGDALSDRLARGCYPLFQVSYPGAGSWGNGKPYPRFLEQVDEGIVGVLAKADEPLYAGIHQHLGAEHAGGVGAVDGGPFQAYSVERCLYYDILLSVDAAAYLVSGPRRYILLIPQAAQFQAVLEAGGGPVVARGQYVLVPYRHGADMMAAANDPKAKLTQIFGTSRTEEQIVPIIDGLVNDVEGQYQVNVPNRGAIEGIPDDVVVEVPAVVTRRGIQPLQVGSLPRKLMLEAILPHWLDMERNLLAFKTGDRSVLLWNALTVIRPVPMTRPWP